MADTAKRTESKGLDQFLARVSEVGGRWERAMGGLLLLHLPHMSDFDAEREFKHFTNCS